MDARLMETFIVLTLFTDFGEQDGEPIYFKTVREVRAYLNQVCFDRDTLIFDKIILKRESFTRMEED